MILSLLGTLIFFAPLCLCLTFQDKRVGFLHALITVIVFHLALGFFTQLLHIFTYLTIFFSSLAFAVTSIIITYKKALRPIKIRINWFAVATFVIIFFQLWSVHYRYTGTASTIVGRTQFEAAAYPYPYYSDEWVGVSLARYSIQNHLLPSVNSLFANAKFTNPLLLFFSFIAELLLLFHLTPLFGYSILALCAGLTVCLLSYTLLRANNASPLAAAITAVGVSYITNGVNLPGIWYLVPYVPSLVLLLICLTALALNRPRTAFISGLLSVILYAPIIVLIAPILFVWWLIKHIPYGRLT